MVKDFTEKLDKSVVVASPVDEILEGVIIKIERGMLKEFLDPKVHEKFDNLEQDTLKFHLEVKFNDKIINVSDKINYYEEPMNNTKLGKFLNKYDTLGVSKVVKVIFDGKGFGKIKVD